MAWSKSARWLIVCSAGLGAAPGCGARASLLTDEIDGQAGTSSLAGSAGLTSGGNDSSTGGRAEMSGAPGLSGSSTGGLALGGSPGAPRVCEPASSECQGNSVSVCDSSGRSRSTRACAEGSSCFVVDGKAQCVTCKPYSRRCGANDDALACSGDGTSWNTVVDCKLRGQRCYLDGCRSLSCLPGQAFCSPSGLNLCDADGAMSALTQACAAGEHCSPTTLACEAGICAPGEPACNGALATTCNADGSDYVVGGDDCSAQPGRQCLEGSCVCQPGRADCNDDTEDGCETDVASDPQNCLTCATTCSSSHVSAPTCDHGCNGKCDAGFGDCNEDKLSDGCETDLRRNDQHCGACGAVCRDGEACVGSRCLFIR